MGKFCNKKMIWVHIERTGGGTFNHSVIQKIYKRNQLKLTNKDEFHICNSLMFNTPTKFFGVTKNSKPKDFEKFNLIGGHMRASKYLFLKRPYITWLRDPINRTISNYYAWKKVAVDDALKPETKKPGKTNREILVLLKDGLDVVEFSKIFKNYMSYLINIDLENFKFIGITENYDKDLIKFGKIFDVTIPKHRPKFHVIKYPETSKDIRKKIASNMKQDYELYNKILRDKSGRF